MGLRQDASFCKHGDFSLARHQTPTLSMASGTAQMRVSKITHMLLLSKHKQSSRNKDLPTPTPPPKPIFSHSKNSNCSFICLTTSCYLDTYSALVCLIKQLEDSEITFYIVKLWLPMPDRSWMAAYAYYCFSKTIFLTHYCWSLHY